MTLLHPGFLRRPIAHRGLHGAGVPENSMAAFRAAIQAGYGIELDIQHAACGTPIVFHDYDLQRLAGAEDFVADMDLSDLTQTRLDGSDETIPTLDELLRLVDGQVPLLIEIKDQDGRLGPNIGGLHDRVAGALAAYDGPVAVMSFNPHTMAAFHATAPGIASGLTTCAFPEDDWPMLDAADRAALAEIGGYDAAGACFVSHQHTDLSNPRLARLKAQGAAILCWTIRSPEAEAEARKTADNITFEGYRA